MTQQTRGEAQNMTVVNLTPSAASGHGSGGAKSDIQFYYDFYCERAAEQGVLVRFKRIHSAGDFSIHDDEYDKMEKALHQAVAAAGSGSASGPGSGSILHPIVTGLFIGLGVWNTAALFGGPTGPRLLLVHACIAIASLVIVMKRLESR